MLAAFFIGHFIKEADHHAEAVLLGEEVAMILDEAPIETVPDLAPIAFWEVGHFSDVVRSRDVGFR